MQADVVQRIAEKRLKYFGHVMRMQLHRLPNIELHGEVHDKRTRGRPKKRWIDNVKEDLESVGVAGGEGFSRTKDREGLEGANYATQTHPVDIVMGLSQVK